MVDLENTEFTTTYKDIWWIVLIHGIVLMLLGIWILNSPVASLSALLVLLGIYWIISGVLHIIEVFTGNTGQSKGWLIFSGILSIIAGIFAINNPFVSTYVASFTVVLITSLLVVAAGITNIVRFFRGAGIGALILGILFGIFGFFLLFNPTEGIAALPTVMGIISFVGGIALIIGSFNLRSVA